MSKKAEAFDRVADKVIDHIDNYVVPQYGDNGDDLATEYTFEDCCKQAERYLKRRNSNSREGQELRDVLKSIHWMSIAYERLEVELETR
jgi:hypothetical protein